MILILSRIKQIFHRMLIFYLLYNLFFSLPVVPRYKPIAARKLPIVARKLPIEVRKLPIEALG